MISVDPSRLQRHRALWDNFIRETSPALFSITMGTGAISTLFHVFPFGIGAQPMIVLSLILFFINLFLFCSFFIILGLKYICYPGQWASLLRNPSDSLCVACLPMGAATLINVAINVVHGRLGYGEKSFLYFIWAIWWLDIFYFLRLLLGWYSHYDHTS